MYVCTYVCMYEFMYVCMYVCLDRDQPCSAVLKRARGLIRLQSIYVSTVFDVCIGRVRCSTVLEVCFDSTWGVFWQFSGCVSIVLQVCRYVSTVRDVCFNRDQVIFDRPLAMFRGRCVLTRTGGMFRPSSRQVFIVLGVCFNRARGMFRQYLRYDFRVFRPGSMCV